MYFLAPSQRSRSLKHSETNVRGRVSPFDTLDRLQLLGKDTIKAELNLALGLSVSSSGVLYAGSKSAGQF